MAADERSGRCDAIAALGALAALRMTLLSREVARTGLSEHAPVRQVVPRGLRRKRFPHGNRPDLADQRKLAVAGDALFARVGRY